MEFLFQPALPKVEDRPAPVLQELSILPVALHISFDLGDPVLPVALDTGLFLLPVAAMPEVSVDEYRHFVFLYRNVGRAGQALDILPVAITQGPQCPAQHQLRPGIRGADFAHEPGALLGRVAALLFGEGGYFDGGVVHGFMVIKYAKDEDEKKLTALYHGKRKK